MRSITGPRSASNSSLARRYRTLCDTRAATTVAIVIVAMATAIAWPGGAFSCTRTSSLPIRRISSLSSAGVVKQSRFLRVSRIASSCGVLFRDVRCDATMAGKESPLEKSATMNNMNLLVVGPGVLGSLVGRRWLEQYEGCKVVGQTNTTNRHEELLSLGISPITKDMQSGDKYPYVIFCAPPSGSQDYVREVRAAAQRWDGEGSLLFTSSSGVYDVHNNGLCDENAPIIEKGKSPRLDMLLNAEEEVLKVGGNVVRLAGLYTRDRGAHTFWLQKGSVDARPDHYLNLIHYEDAADLCIAILKKKIREQVFMGCDNTPVTRQDIMDITLQSGKFKGGFRGFTKSEGPLGKKMNNNRTREMVEWQPQYHSFGDFINRN